MSGSMRPRGAMGGDDRAMAGIDDEHMGAEAGPSTVDVFEPVEGLCNANKTDGSGLCKHEAGWGTDHVGFGTCRKHAGSTPSGRANGQKLREAALLGPLLAAEKDRIGDHPDPFEGMLELVRLGWAWLRMLEARIGELGDGVVGEAEGEQLVIADHAGDLRPHALVGMLLEARREHRRNCEAAIRAGIAERMVSLAEDQADAMARLIRGVLTDLGHDLEEPETAATVRRHLRALPSAS